MRVAVAVVMSLDGKLTRHYDPDIHSWVSQEDQNYFRPLVDSQDVVIMGRHTYEAVKSYIKLDSQVKRVVVTHDPKKYVADTAPGVLEFTDSSPDSVIKQAGQDGYQKILVVGGAPIITALLKSRCIHSLLITVEPRLFGTGDSFLVPEELNIELQLIQSRRLNERGTLLLEYQIEKTPSLAG